jgi:hypothetical protein
MNRRLTLCRFIAAVMIACACGGPLRAQSTLEYEVKAALLLNFARFIEWPDRAFAGQRAAIDICVFAPNPFGQALERALQGEMVGMRPLSTRDVHSAAEAAGCHLLFVPAGTELRAAALVRQIGSPTITVGESRRFEDLGGALSFVLEGGRVRFTVNLRPVEARGVRISARMLNLASRVDRAPEK